MSKFAMICALMLATGYAAYCLVIFPNTDIHFIYAAYVSGGISVILVFTELIRLIFRGIFDGLEWMHERRLARRNARVNKVLNEPLIDNQRTIRPAINDPVSTDTSNP